MPFRTPSACALCLNGSRLHRAGARKIVRPEAVGRLTSARSIVPSPAYRLEMANRYVALWGSQGSLVSNWGMLSVFMSNMGLSGAG